MIDDAVWSKEKKDKDGVWSKVNLYKSPGSSFTK